MDENFDELGNYVGPPEYSDSGASDPEGWEDVEDAAEDNGNALVKSLYGPNVEVAHYKHDTQDAAEPLVAPEKPVLVPQADPQNWEFHKGIMDSAPGLIRNIAVVGHVDHGKSSFVELFTGAGTTDTSALEKQRQLTLSLSAHTSLVQDSKGKSYVFNIADTPGHADFNDEVRAAEVLACDDVLVVDAVEGPVLPGRVRSPSVVVVNKLDRLILDLRLPPSQAFDRLHALVVDELGVDPERVVFMSTKFRFAFTLRSIASLYQSFQNVEGDLQLWNATNFVNFVLDPLYKLFSYGLLGARSRETLASLDITLSDLEWHLGYDDRIRLIVGRFFEDSHFTAVVDTLVKFTRPPKEASEVGAQMALAKNVRVGNDVLTLARVNYGFIDTQMSHTLFIPFGSRVVSTKRVYAGNWALLVTAHKPPSISATPLAKVGVEPLRHSISVSEKMTSALETIARLRSALRVKVMETGEYCIWGAGELYLDCAVHELKALSNCDLHVGPPSAQLIETVSEQSYAACPAKTDRAGSSITVVATPLSPQLMKELESDSDTKEVLLKHGWSSQDAAAVRAFYEGNLLSVDSGAPIVDTVDPGINEILVQGFEWACNEGPLMEEPLKQVHFKIVELTLNSTVHLLPTVRRACHAAMLLASPRVMEPWMQVTVIGRLGAGKAVYSELAKRRGVVEADRAILGTNLYVTRGVIPLMDAFGFEIDVLCNLSQRNEAQVTLDFLDWRVVDGDPLDTSIAAPRLKPAVGSAMARDYVLKTRRRKGLLAEVNLDRYLDEEVLAAIAQA